MLTVKKDFTYYHGGCNPAQYTAGQIVDVEDEEMIEVAISQGWATDGEEKPAKAPAKAKK
mgnify:FL=1